MAKKSIRASVQTTIKKRAEDRHEVFMAFANPQYSVMVDPSTISATLIGGEPMSKGAKYEIQVKNPLPGAGPIKETQEYTAFDPPYHLTIDIQQDSMSGPEDETFGIDADGWITVHWIANYELSGAMALPGVSSLIEKTVQKKSQVWIDNMAKAIEAGRKPPE